MKIYFMKTNGYNAIVFTDGEMATVREYTPTGMFDGIGIDLYSTDAVEQCRKYFMDLAADENLNGYAEIADDMHEIPFQEIEEEPEIELTLIYEDED